MQRTEVRYEVLPNDSLKNRKKTEISYIKEWDFTFKGLSSLHSEEALDEEISDTKFSQYPKTKYLLKLNIFFFQTANA